MNETLFSTRGFIEAWLRGQGSADQLIAIPVRGSGEPRELCGVQRISRFGLRSITLAPASLYASPGWRDHLDPWTMRRILWILRGTRTKRFAWSVRFDQLELARALMAHGIPCVSSETHVLELGSGYDAAFAHYNTTTRNHVRRSRKEGVIVRDATGVTDIERYCAVCDRLEAQNPGYVNKFRPGFFAELLTLRESIRILIAEYRGEVIAGGVFFRDGRTVMYWHGAADREFSKVYPMCAVIDEAVRWACTLGATTFNFGGSMGKKSLEQFKSSWGATPREVWKFRWENPVLNKLFQVRSFLGDLKDA